MNSKELNALYKQYSTPGFIPDDPIRIPHQFSIPEDIEIAGFLAATLSWGNRKTIIRNTEKIISWMDHQPFNFVLNHQPKDLIPMRRFVHRTFNGDDLLGFMACLQNIYQTGGLKTLFPQNSLHEENLRQFYKRFFCVEVLPRTHKHVANISSGSAGKRLNMFLRWMVRPALEGIDFGIWNHISASDLFIPLDVHTARIARKLGLLVRSQNDWKAVVELTQNLRKYDQSDPVKYDFALFGMGVSEKSAI